MRVLTRLDLILEEVVEEGIIYLDISLFGDLLLLISLMLIKDLSNVCLSFSRG